MRIEDILTQSISTKNLKNQRQREEAPVAFAPPRDTVTISQAARDAQKNGVDLTRAARESQQQEGGSAGFTGQKTEADNPLRAQFKTFMDKALNRGVAGGGKSPEEKMEELTEKLKKLKTRLSEVMTDDSLSEDVRSSRMEAINSQIKAVQEQIDQLGREMAEQMAG